MDDTAHGTAATSRLTEAAVAVLKLQPVLFLMHENWKKRRMGV